MFLATTSTSKAPSNRIGRKSSEHQSTGPSSVIISTFRLDIEPTLETLGQDAQLHITSFLDESSLRSFASINTFFRSFVLSIPESKQVIWMSRLSRRWNVPMNESIFGLLKDYTGLPTAATLLESTMERTPVDTLPAIESRTRRIQVNLPVLLSMTSPQIPSEVDRSSIDRADSSSFRMNLQGSDTTVVPLRATWQKTLKFTNCGSKQNDSSDSNDEDQQQHKDNNIITYTGPIGVGNRCVRSNHPLPRPNDVTFENRALKGSILKRKRSHPTPAPGVRSAKSGGLLSALRQSVGALRRDGKTQRTGPFCCPYFDKDGTLNVTPTLVAYYEVDILREIKGVGKVDDHGYREQDTDAVSHPPCVAIGLATKDFRLQSQMPGWDSHSVGYHGDDGRIFFGGGSTSSSSQFGPTFGTGDTVGCGIDYVTRGIFFTLNGQFLGYGWKNIRSELLDRNWFPVVGIDTNAPIRLNFGRSPQHPFLYDLEEFHSLHQQVIQPLYRFSTPSASRRKNRFRHHRLNTTPLPS